MFNNIATILMSAILLVGVSCNKVLGPTSICSPTIQKLSSHTLYVLGTDFEPITKCTAVAIAPHAILTAEHCVGKSVPDSKTFFNMDLSTHLYSVLYSFHDDHDHVIYVVDGTPFKNILPVKYLISHHDAKIGRVTMFGASSGETFGIAVPTHKDDSDVNQRQGIRYYNLSARSGDSGALVFEDDGSVSSVLTYRMGDHLAAGFTLAFPDNVYNRVLNERPWSLNETIQADFGLPINVGSSSYIQ